MSLRLFKQTCRCRDVLPLDTAALYTAITGRLGSFRSVCFILDNERSLVVGRIHYTFFVPLFAHCILLQLLLSNGNTLLSLCNDFYSTARV